jgi:hypothetical protein
MICDITMADAAAVRAGIGLARVGNAGKEKKILIGLLNLYLNIALFICSRGCVEIVSTGNT